MSKALGLSRQLWCILEKYGTVAHLEKTSTVGFWLRTPRLYILEKYTLVGEPGKSGQRKGGRTEQGMEGLVQQPSRQA